MRALADHRIRVRPLASNSHEVPRIAPPSRRLRAASLKDPGDEAEAILSGGLQLRWRCSRGGEAVGAGAMVSSAMTSNFGNNQGVSVARRVAPRPPNMFLGATTASNFGGFKSVCHLASC